MLATVAPQRITELQKYIGTCSPKATLYSDAYN